MRLESRLSPVVGLARGRANLRPPSQECVTRRDCEIRKFNVAVQLACIFKWKPRNEASILLFGMRFDAGRFFKKGDGLKMKPRRPYCGSTARERCHPPHSTHPASSNPSFPALRCDLLPVSPCSVPGKTAELVFVFVLAPCIIQIRWTCLRVTAGLGCRRSPCPDPSFWIFCPSEVDDTEWTPGMPFVSASKRLDKREMLRQMRSGPTPPPRQLLAKQNCAEKSADQRNGDATFCFRRERLSWNCRPNSCAKLRFVTRRLPVLGTRNPCDEIPALGVPIPIY
jgi:hypothetical protein